MPLTRYLAELAWLGGDRAAADVAIDVDGGRIVAVRPGSGRPDAAGGPAPPAIALPGLTLPGFANAHSHAFHRALRGRTQRGGGTFWTWRADMYALAARLDPPSYRRLARAVFAEMALAGISCVGEFHYLHHDVDGRPYAAANAMGEALAQAAGEAGIRITLLDTCYLAGGIDRPLSGPQLRFGDGDVAGWAERADALAAAAAAWPHARVGAAIHSVRAVPANALGPVAAWARSRTVPLHLHLSEQRAENEACQARYGCSPTRLLADHGALGPATTAVHATHLAGDDVALLAAAGTAACLTPTTEADLGDGLGRAGDLAAAGVALALGSDSNTAIDPFAEARGLEYGARLRAERRGRFTAAALLAAATRAGHGCLGWPDAGRIAPGARADLVTVSLGSVRLAGAEPATALESVVFTGCPADVTDVVVDGRPVVRGGRHLLLDDVPGELAAAIRAVPA